MIYELCTLQPPFTDTDSINTSQPIPITNFTGLSILFNSFYCYRIISNCMYQILMTSSCRCCLRILHNVSLSHSYSLIHLLYTTLNNSTFKSCHPHHLPLHQIPFLHLPPLFHLLTNTSLLLPLQISISSLINNLHTLCNLSHLFL